MAEAEAEIVWPPEGSRKIHIVHVESPSEIFVRDQFLENEWNKLEEEFKTIMVEHLHTKFKSTILPEDLVDKSVMVRKKTVLYRGKVLKMSLVHSKGPQHMATCRLVDFGRTEIIPISDLMPLPVELKKYNGFCVCLKLSGIAATGGSKDPENWTITAKEAIRKILNLREYFMIQQGKQYLDKGAKLYKVPAALLFRETIQRGPFDPIGHKIVDIKDLLMEQGLAMVPRGLTNGQGDRNDTGIDDEVSFFDKSLAVNQTQGGSKLDTSTVSTKSTLNEVWPKPRFPKKEEFLGVITHIDSEGQIYIQDELGEKVSEAMSKILSNIHSKIARKDDNLKWLPGCAAIAEYSDQSWNRVMVTEINRSNGLIGVLFIDFGETCFIDPKENTCHNMPLFFEQVPIQALRCKLENIVPKDGRYSKEFIKKMDEKIVGKKVTVRITRKSVKSFPLPVILHLTEGENTRENIARIFMKEGAVEKMGSPQAWFQGKERENEIAAHIQPTRDEVNEREEQNLKEDIIFCSKIFPDIPTIPLQLDEYLPVVYSYTSADFLFVAPSCDFSEDTIIDKEIRGRLLDLKEQFEEMQEAIQNETENSNCDEPVVVPIAFHPFLVKWEDDMWYRCMIYDFKTESKMVSVFFVDYGNMQDCRVTDLRYMPLKHMKVPIQIFHLDKPFLVGNEITAKFGGDFEKFLTKSKLAVTKVSGDKISLCYLENKQWQRL